MDCADTACFGDPACFELLCSDGLDNDSDRFVDCLDTDCSSGCFELCNDGVDNDGDALIDCRDLDCFGDPSCTETDCSDGIDNDFDDGVDCFDFECFGSCGLPVDRRRTVATGSTMTMTGNSTATTRIAPGPACVGGPATDGVDNNGNGRVDCADDQCFGDIADCVETECDNGIDDDGDGYVDCVDVDCGSMGGVCP